MPVEKFSAPSPPAPEGFVEATVNVAAGLEKAGAGFDVNIEVTAVID